MSHVDFKLDDACYIDDLFFLQMRYVLHRSPFYGVMIDECVDIAVREQLVMILRFITPDAKPRECFQ